MCVIKLARLRSPRAQIITHWIVMTKSALKSIITALTDGNGAELTCEDLLEAACGAGSERLLRAAGFGRQRAELLGPVCGAADGAGDAVGALARDTSPLGPVRSAAGGQRAVGGRRRGRAGGRAQLASGGFDVGRADGWIGLDRRLQQPCGQRTLRRERNAALALLDELLDDGETLQRACGPAAKS